MIDSAGYEGTVDEPEWSDLLASAGGRQYSVAGAGDWKVTPGTGADRQVQIAAGRGFGYGVRDVSDAVENLTLPASSSGTVWHLIAARRDWGANETTFVSIPGSSSKQIPSARETSPGSVDEQPIALVPVVAGQSTIAAGNIVDLRVWGGDGGALAQDELALQFLNRLGTVVRVGTNVWSRVLDNLGSPTWRKTAGDKSLGTITPASGVSINAETLVSLDVDGVVTGYLDAGTPEGAPWSAAGLAGVLPVGFRPASSISFIHRSYTAGVFANTVNLGRIDPSGEIWVNLMNAAGQIVARGPFTFKRATS